MKLTFFLSLITISQLWAIESYSQMTKLSLKLEDTKISEVLKDIENQSEFFFLYSPNKIDVDSKINIDVKNETLKDILPKIFGGNVKISVYDRQIILSPAGQADISASLLQQQGRITGIVVDKSGLPLAGVNVIITGTTQGTITDMDGKYSLDVPQGSKSLSFTFIGMQQQDVAIGSTNQINVKMLETALALDEVVVVGYGTQTRRQITGSVANVNSEDFTKGVTRFATDLLQGKVSGLMINSSSGDVTQTSVMRLRGISTLMEDTGPLVVIDGIPGGDLNTVSPSDVESITVLKDATSAAIYGSRAAGGVVLITTKKGTIGKSTVTYDAYVSMDVLANKPKLMNADQWRAYAAYSGQNPTTYDQYGADTDWFDELTRKAVSNSHNLSLAGGTARSNYRASYTYLDRNGVMSDNSSRSHSFRLQAQQNALNDKLKLGITGSLTSTDQTLPDAGNYILAYNMLPVYPVYNPDGTFFTKVNKEYDQGNPVQNMKLNPKENEMLFFYGSGDIQYTIIDGLNIKANLYKSRFSKNYSAFDNSETEGGQANLGYAIKQNEMTNRELMEWTLDFNKTIGVHKIQAMAGYSWENNMYSIFFAQNRNFLSNSLSYNSLQSGNGLKTGDVSSGKNGYTLISLFGRAFYGFKDRYMLTAMLRYDGSSKFGANNKWGMFPSVSVAWGISEEEFMKNISWIKSLKLRAGYGVTGNQSGLAPYKTLQLYNTSGIYYNNGSWSTAYAISQNANPDLKWESTATTNVGLDYTLFNNRLSGTIEWYNKLTSDMLYTYTVPTPPYVYSSMMANVGDMKNTGVELLFNISVVKSPNFTYNTILNGSYNKNEVTRLSNDIYSTSRVYTGAPWIRGGSGVTSSVIEEGKPVGQFFMLQCSGLDANGKYVFTDLNGDGVINDSDRTYSGQGLPDIIFGWNNNLSYKNLDFSVFFRGTLGNKVLNNPIAAYGNNTYLIGTNAINNDLLYQLKGQSSQISSFYLENGSFMRLDNMSLGYTFNTKSITWLTKARVYLAGQNVLVITKYKGTDPEVNLGGLAPGIEPRDFYPKARTFTCGLNLTF